MDRCIQSLRIACHWLRLLPAWLMLAGTSVSVATTDSNSTLVAVVGAYHFVSKANWVNMQVDDPLSPARRVQIEELVKRLGNFHPTKVVLEHTSGSSDVEQHYQDYLQGRWTLGASENYQIGFRLAKQLGLPRVYMIQVDADLDFDAVDAYAKAHDQTYLVDASRQLAERLVRRAAEIQSKGTVLDVYRYLNSEAAIRLNDSSYTYLCRIGDDGNFVGADLVSAWHQRNLRMFAKLSRLSGPGERILVLYGQGHAYLLRDFIRQAPDMKLIDAESLLR
jgi:uncharacterized protein DUF5694